METQHIEEWFSANYLDGDKVQGGQMISSEECLGAVREAYQAGIDEEKNRIWSALCDLAEPDERQIGAGDLKTHLDDVHKIIFITKP